MFFCFWLMFSYVISDIFNTTIAVNVPLDDYLSGAQICSAWRASENGPTLASLQYCEGQLFFGCLSATDQTLLSVVGQAPANASMQLAVNSSSTYGNATFFKTSYSFGFALNTTSDIPTLVCAAGSGTTTLCFNVFGNNASFGSGAYCGKDGYLSADSVILFVFSVPCRYASVGDSCIIPGVNLCAVNSTCQPSQLCNGTLLTPPVLPDNACYTHDECDPDTGLFINVTSLVGTSCSNNNPCTVNEQCDGNRTCTGGSLNCSFSPANCLWKPYCNATTGYTCQWEPMPNGTFCSNSGGFPCRGADFCDLYGNCIDGATIPIPPFDMCVYSNVTCNNITKNYDYWKKPDNITCNGTNLCETGKCGDGKCGSFVANNSTLGPISACLLPACHPENGTWYTVSANNAGVTCIYPNLTNPDVCAYGECDGDVTCLLLAPFFTCPINSSNTCLNYTCDPNQTFENRCNNPIPVVGNKSCDVNNCNINGYCDAGLCVGTQPNNCTHLPYFDPRCGYAYCKLTGSGCDIFYFNSTVPCYDDCYVNGTAFCRAGRCVSDFYTPACSTAFASSLLSYAYFFFF